MRTAFSAIFQKACRSLTFAQYSEQRLLFFFDTAMRIQYASDLHLTFGRNFQYVLSGGIKPEGDVFVLAGDIAEIQHLERYDAFWDWCSEHFKETIFVPGNHDWYGCWISIMR